MAAPIIHRLVADVYTLWCKKHVAPSQAIVDEQQALFRKHAFDGLSVCNACNLYFHDGDAGVSVCDAPECKCVVFCPRDDCEGTANECSGTCGKLFCDKCIEECNHMGCDIQLCYECAHQCPTCMEYSCAEHMARCTACNALVCVHDTCYETCLQCGKGYCWHECTKLQPNRVCLDCHEYCAQCRTAAVASDLIDCGSCGNRVCPEHMAPCGQCWVPHCGECECSCK